MNAHQVVIPVTCRAPHGSLSVSGSARGQTLSSTLSGAVPSMVVTDVGPHGANFYQARNGMIDGAGRHVGRMTVRRVGTGYQGDLTFVLVTVGPNGRKVPMHDHEDVKSGHYSLSCPHAPL